MAHRGLKFGIFLAPFHRLGENPTLAIDRDVELLQWLDHLGYDEAWIGEHHSAGWELIAAPELIIAAAAEKTKHIKLGSGVTSLPYHHPMMVAQRWVQLDHMTRGRAMLGCGPGALTSDAYMLGIEPATQRPRMLESLEAIMALLRMEEPVTRKTDWFEMRDARLHMAPYSDPHFEIAVASTITPFGMIAAGTQVDKQSVGDVGMKGAPGSSLFVGGVTYVVVDGGVQFKFKDLDKGGPAGRNNNPGNITVDDANPDAWDAAIGAYRGRNTDGRFAIFPTIDRGKAGAKAWAARSPTLSLLAYFQKYAPSSEAGNKPEDYADTVARHVSAAVKAKGGKPAGRGTAIQEVIDAKAMDDFVDGQIEAEGFTQANISLVGNTDAKLPQAVRDFVGGFDKATDDTNAAADKVAAAAAKENPP